MPDNPQAVARLIRESRSGDENALSQLFPVVYQELRRLAGNYMRREARQTLPATALVHEAYLRLLAKSRCIGRTGLICWVSRPVPCGRSWWSGREREWPGSGAAGQHAVTLIDETLGQNARSIDFMALDQALRALAELDPKQARLVELRFFGGLTLAETSEVMGISPATTKRWWALSRAWLRRELNG